MQAAQATLRQSSAALFEALSNKAMQAAQATLRQSPAAERRMNNG